jgi:hypothetical protein
VSDIFREVEEDVRRERYEKLWKEYGDYIIAGAAFLVIGAAGWQLWRYYEQRETLRAASEYTAAQQLLDAGQTAAAAQAYGKLADDAPGGYAAVSRLQEAGALLAAGRPDDSLKLYGQIAQGSDPMLAAVARVRAAWVIADTAPKSDVQTMLASLTEPNSAWNSVAREVLAYVDYRSGDIKQALADYQSLAKDRNAPASLHERSAAMATYLSAGGSQNFGTVPAPQQPTIPSGTTPTPPAAPAAPENPQGAHPK